MKQIDIWSVSILAKAIKLIDVHDKEKQLKTLIPHK